MSEREQFQSMPDWLLQPESYDPPKDRDGFLTKNILSLTSLLASFRLDDGAPSRLPFSAAARMMFVFGIIVLVSLSRNFAFTATVLACLLVKLCFMRREAFVRTVATSFGAAGLSILIMVPAILFGQAHSIALISVKVLTSVGLALSTSLSMPFNQFTAALRCWHVPDLLILTFDMALKSIVSLGTVALECLTALKLRSIGHNRSKGTSLGGVAGVVFLKSQEAAETTHEAMRCRGFDGSYAASADSRLKPADLALLVLFALAVALFAYLQGVVL